MAKKKAVTKKKSATSTSKKKTATKKKTAKKKKTTSTAKKKTAKKAQDDTFDEGFEEKPKQKVKHRPGQYLLSHQTDNTPYPVAKHNNGRPTTYKPEYCQDIVEFMGQGKSLAQWATKHGISPQCIMRWPHKYPDFRKAKDVAIQAHMAYWESIGEAGTTGKIPGFRDSTYRFMMKNRFPHVYKDVHQVEQTTTIKFETFVNEHGQIEQTRQDLLEGEVIEENEQDRLREPPEKQG